MHAAVDESAQERRSEKTCRACQQHDPRALGLRSGPSRPDIVRQTTVGQHAIEKRARHCRRATSIVKAWAAGVCERRHQPFQVGAIGQERLRERAFEPVFERRDELESAKRVDAICGQRRAPDRSAPDLTCRNSATARRTCSAETSLDCRRYCVHVVS